MIKKKIDLIQYYNFNDKITTKRKTKKNKEYNMLCLDDISFIKK